MDLPPTARRKIADIEQGADDADALSRSAFAAIDAAQRRLADFTNLRDSKPDTAEGSQREIDTVEAEIARLRQMQQARQARSANDRQVLAQVRSWIARIGPVGIETAPTVDAVPRKGESVTAAVERVRQEIFGLKDELEALRRAPLPAAELKAKARALVDELAERGRPVITTEQGAFEVKFRQPGAMVPGATPQDVAAFFAWIDPDTLLERLTGEIGDTEGVSAADRARREPELAARILAAERVEEGLIGQAPEVARRPDANPLAILGVMFAAEAQAA